jgi:hypothetical protein
MVIDARTTDRRKMENDNTFGASTQSALWCGGGEASSILGLFSYQITWPIVDEICQCRS